LLFFFFFFFCLWRYVVDCGVCDNYQWFFLNFILFFFFFFFNVCGALMSHVGSAARGDLIYTSKSKGFTVMPKVALRVKLAFP
jgi:hypothetical protein